MSTMYTSASIVLECADNHDWAGCFTVSRSENDTVSLNLDLIDVHLRSSHPIVNWRSVTCQSYENVFSQIAHALESISESDVELTLADMESFFDTMSSWIVD